MNTESSFFTLLLLVGSIYTVVGMLTYVFPPKNINYLYGYRTNSSMKSQERWSFAQTYSSKLMIFLGISIALLSCLGLFVSFSDKIDFYIGISIFVLSIIALFVKTERALKIKFPKD